jgi:hypothetical protein
MRQEDLKVALADAVDRVYDKVGRNIIVMGAGVFST